MREALRCTVSSLCPTLESRKWLWGDRSGSWVTTPSPLLPGGSLHPQGMQNERHRAHGEPGTGGRPSPGGYQGRLYWVLLLRGPKSVLLIPEKCRVSTHHWLWVDVHSAIPAFVTFTPAPLTAAWFTVVQTGNSPRAHLLVAGYTQRRPSMDWNVTQPQRRVKPCHAPQREQALTTRCSVRDARPTRPCSMWPHSCGMSTTGKSAGRMWVCRCQGLGEGAGSDN